MSFNPYEQAAKGGANVVRKAASAGIDIAKEMTLGNISRIMKWTAGSIWNVLMSGGKAAIQGAASLPVFPKGK